MPRKVEEHQGTRREDIYATAKAQRSIMGLRFGLFFEQEGDE